MSNVDPIDSAITPVDVDHVEAETAAQAQQTDTIEDQILASGPDGGVEVQEAAEAQQAVEVKDEDADIAKLGWATSE